MEDIIKLIAWLKSNWFEISQAIAMIIAGASVIVRLTPTLKDDNILLPIIKFVGKYIALDRAKNDDKTRNGG